MRHSLRPFAILVLAAFAVFFALSSSYAQDEKKPPIQHGQHFVDKDGDGYNDLAPDHDKDGIPNGQDPDYVKPGTGGKRGPKGFVDENGDGINDLAPDDDGDGIPNGQDPDYVRSPKKNGQGYGKGRGRRFHGFVDEDGDGINDNIMDHDNDGVPNGQDPDWVRPEDCLRRGAKMGGRFWRGRGFMNPGPAGQNQNPGKGGQNQGGDTKNP